MLAKSLMIATVALLLIADLRAEEPRPNILVILADDLGWGELGCQGFTKEIPTPHIDSLASGGVRFTSGYVSGPYCSPTRAGLMTGRYQQRSCHEFNPGPAESAVKDFGLSLQEKTIGDYLKEANYATGWFGKSHLGYKPQFHPMKRGFDKFYGFLGGAHDYRNPQSDAANPIFDGTTPVKEMGYATEDFAQKACEFIEANRDRNWFCYLPFNAVHAPLQATQKYEDRFPKLTDPKRRAFAAMLSALDDSVGKVLEKIRELKQEDNTLIVFFSDNGGPTPSTTSSNALLRGYKAQTWEGGIRVPFLMQWKNKFPQGVVEDRPVIQLDILPTVLSAASIPVPESKLDGVNLIPYVTKQKLTSPHDALYWRFGKQIAIRMDDWKLVKAAGMPVIAGNDAESANTQGAELYNLRNDIGEKNNLAEQEPDKLKELSAAWDKWNNTLVEPSWKPNRPRAAKRANRANPQKVNAN